MLPVYAQRLSKARAEAKLSQVEVMKLTGINNKTISNYEKGISEPDYDTLLQLCNLYGIESTDWVLGYTNNPDVQMDEDQRVLSSKIELGDNSFVESFISLDGMELTKEQKEKLQAMARLLLQQDR